MKKSKKILIIFIAIIMIVLIELLSYRFALLQYNKPINGENYKTLEKLDEIIEIENSNNDNLKTYLDISYPNFKENFEFAKDKSSNRYSSYYLYKDDDTYTLLASYKVGFATTYIEDIYTIDGIKQKDIKRLLEKYEIENNFDVINYLVDHYDDKVNIFSSKDDIMIKYLMNSYANTKLLSGSFKSISGDLDGFMIISSDNSTIEVSLKKEQKEYFFSFTNGTDSEFFTEEYITNFLKSVTISE